MADHNLGKENQDFELNNEFSKKMYLKEQKERDIADVDLIVIEDPVVIQRNLEIEKIKQLNNLLCNPQMAVQNTYATKNIFTPNQNLNFQLTHLPNILPHSFQLSNEKNLSIIDENILSKSDNINNQFKKYLTNKIEYNTNPFLPCTSITKQNLQSSTPNIQSDKFLQTNSFLLTSNDKDLIDFESTSESINKKLITIEDFDPLFKQQKLDCVIKNDEPEKSCNKDLTVLEKIAKNVDKNKSYNNVKKLSNSQKLFTCDNLKTSTTLSCDFYNEKTLLDEASKKLMINVNKKNVFFLSPVVDYYTTSAESIKLVVHQDDTWRKDIPDDFKKIEFACDLRSTIEEILVYVLLRLLPQEQISKNNGTIPLDKYALKVYGSDEFLVPSAEIGKHPFVNKYLSNGKDVELEVGRKCLPQPFKCLKNVENSLKTLSVVTKELFETLYGTIKNHIQKCIDDPLNKNLRQSVIQSIKMLTIFMNNVQPLDLITAIETFCVDTSSEKLKYSVHCIVVALKRLVTMYCKSALTDFSVIIDSDEDEQNNKKEVRDVSLCNDKVLISIETLHNLPIEWQTKYRAYFIEAHLMYGTKSYGMVTSNLSAVSTKYHFQYVFFFYWAEFDAYLSSLPRETQICFIVKGIPLNIESSENEFNSFAPSAAIINQEMLSAHQIAFVSLPLYNYKNFFLQGAVLLPLSLMCNNMVHPWGPRPLIRNSENPVLLVKCLEYEYEILFPAKLQESTGHWREFTTLPIEEQNNLTSILESGIKSHILSDDDKQLVWSNRNCLYHISKALPLVLASSFSWGVYSLSNIYILFDKWEKLSPVTAIELLLPHFQDKIVREKAVEYIRNGSSEFLFNLLTQFVEALRYEKFENSALALFLLEQSTKNRRFAFELYWQLHQRILNTKDNSYSARCFLLQQLLLELNISGFQNEIVNQHIFLKHLDKILLVMKDTNESNMNLILKNCLNELNNNGDLIRNVRLPINPAFQSCSILVENCGYFNSLTKPIKIIVKGRKTNYGIIFKNGDDLRQDAIVLQLVGLMNDIWLNNLLDLRMITFRCLPTDLKKGLIELVPDCKTLREIQTTTGATGVFKDDVLNSWLLRHNPSEFQYKAALENFRRSCAGWCVATYVLGIGDRHNDNILVTTTGHVFHIDFGKYMGNWQTAAGFKRDRVPFVLTADMAYVINQGSQNTTEHFQMFIDDCCKAFNLLQRNCSMLINIIRFMSCSDIPGMNMDSVGFVESNLMLDLEEMQATAVFTRLIEESLRSKFPRLNFFAHTLAQLKNNPLLFSGRSEDMNRLSFISDMYSDKTDARIESVHVWAYEKWHTSKEKIYMYKLIIRRHNENVTSTIYRSYAEFQELHWKLCFRFSSKAIPSLTLNSAIIGRTNVRAVASKRQIEIENFLQRLFNLSDEVAHSDLVYTFFHTIYRDSEPEVVKNQEVGMNLRNDYLNPPQIHLRMSFNESTAEFRVFVGHAKQLPLIGTREQAPDSYVKTYLRTSHTPQLKHWKRKTGIVKSTQNPTYNTELLYSLGHKDLNEFIQIILELSIWQAGSAVLKDNFQLCESSIPLNCFELIEPDRRGTRVLEKWYNLT